MKHRAWIIRYVNILPLSLLKYEMRQGVITESIGLPGVVGFLSSKYISGHALRGDGIRSRPGVLHPNAFPDPSETNFAKSSQKLGVHYSSTLANGIHVG